MYEAYQKEYREKHRTALLEAKRLYNKEHLQGRREYLKEWHKRNPQEGKKYYLTNYQKKKALRDSFKDKPCADCGNKYPPYVMQFDHIEGFTKLFNIARGMLGNKAAFIEEVKKCEVVCANCHAIRTHKRRNK
jgi:predicted HNH restriction endonuclease